MSTSTTNLPTVALAGSTGYLGSQVLTVLTSPAFRPSFNDVVVLKRKKPSSDSEDSHSTSSNLYTIRYYDESNLSASLQDIDVLINTIGPTGHSFKDALLRAIPSSPTVKLYIPSEFGVDHTVHDFPHEEWNHKKTHFSLAQEILSSKTKVCRIFIGLFTEASIGPWFAFDTKNAIYEAVGSADMPISFTSLEDTGRVIARVASMPLDQIPPQIHVASDTLTIKELARIMEDAGSDPIRIEEVDLARYKETVIREGTTDPSKYLRFLMGEGKINHTQQGLGNDNELVNPGERLWKWKSMKEYAEDTKGRPWVDYEWDAGSVK